MHSRLSDAALRLQGQPMFKLLSKIKERERNGEQILHFEIGDPDFTTPDNIINSSYSAMKNGLTHYSDSFGDYSLRETIANANQRFRGFVPDINQILITPGANISIYYALRCLLNPGDEVIISDPCFATYISVINFCGVIPITVKLKEENEFRMDPNDVLDKITEKTKLIIVNSPHNPTGAVMSSKELEEIANIAIDNNIYLYLDEIYRELIYGNIKFYSPSIIDCCKSHIIVADGFSKAYAMTGWRLGYIIGPSDVIDKMRLLLESTSSCVPTFIQKAGIEALTNSKSSIEMMINSYKRRRDLLVDGLNSIDGISCLKPDGAFYVFPNIINTGIDCNTFALKVLNECNIGLLPGTDFGNAGYGHLRLCYATSDDNIIECISRLSEFVDKNK